MSIGNSQTIQDNTRSILIGMLGVHYQEVLKQIQQEDPAVMGTLFDHDVIKAQPEYFEIMYNKNEDMGEYKKMILFQREYEDINQLDYYIGTLNNSNLYKSEKRWVWFQYSYSCGDIKYELNLMYQNIEQDN